MVPFAAVHAHYSRAQSVTGCQSFDDQIYLAVADMLGDPDHRHYIEGRFDHILVDEFQDLNGAQLALVDVLSRPRRDLFVVGDDDQLIYGWRSADPRGILEFHQRMPPRPWSATYTLCTNYRCSRAVVESAARLVANNAVREDKDVRPREGAAEGALRFAGAPTWPVRAATLCAFLRAEKSRLGCAWRDLAVLCRYRSQQLAVALALDAEEIPRTPALGYKLFSHPGAALLRAYIDLARAPEDMPGDRLRSLLNRPNRYVSNAVAEAVGAAPRPWAHLRTLADGEPATGPRRLSELVDGVRTLAAALSTPSDGETALDPAARAGPHGRRARVGRGRRVRSRGLLGCLRRSARRAAGRSRRAPGARRPAGARRDLPRPRCLPLSLGPASRRRDRAHRHGRRHAGARRGGARTAWSSAPSTPPRGASTPPIAIPDYDCDVTRWEAAQIEEERRVVYVGVTRARDSALLTVDTSRPYVHPFLRELVERPAPDEHGSLSAWLQDEECPDLRTRIAARIAEVETLFPELAPARQS